MLFDPEIETRSPEDQFKIDAETYQQQINYLFDHSDFYKKKLVDAGFPDTKSVGALQDIQHLPFTEKDELRQSQVSSPPFGEHLACDPAKLVRIYSTSGTSGKPCYVGLTGNDLDMFSTNVARGYTAAGFLPQQCIIATVNAGPFTGGAAYNGFDKLGCRVIPVGSGNTERLIDGIRILGATGLSCTPSYGLYLIDWCQDRNIDTKTLGLRNMITAGEPGGGDPMIRDRLQQAFDCQVREAMGISDISLTVWAEDEDAQGMHFMARGFVHVELIDPESGKPVSWEDGASGELVYTALRREAMPLLRFRSRDHATVCLKPNPTGRTGPRIRCFGRTDDMLIVRGVNLFPSGIRNILNEFKPDIGEIFQIRPRLKSVSQPPPLPVVIELANGVASARAGLKEKLTRTIRERLVVTVEIELVPYGSLPREKYKTSLVDFSYADTIN